VGIEQGQVDELFGRGPWCAELKSVGSGGGWTEDELGRSPGRGEKLGGGFVADGDAGRDWSEAGKAGDFGCTGEEFFKFQNLRGWQDNTEEDFVAMSVDGGGGGLGHIGQHFEPGDGDYGDLSGLRQTFDG
jgi:hypothetical protein